MELTQENLIFAAIILAAVIMAMALFYRRKPRGTEPAIADPFERLRHALGKTRGGLLDAIRRTLGGGLSEEVIGSLEEILLRADIGVQTTGALLDGLREAYGNGELRDQAQVIELLKTRLVERLNGERPQLNKAESGPTVILVCGVNGSGKTTSIAKLTHFLAEQGKKVLLCASDTFRAAAVEQLNKWATRLDVEIVKGQHGQDPAAVAHDAHEKALHKQFDYLIIDTAGRLHTEKNLMRELEKIARVGKKHIAGSPHEALLVLDATTGQNAVRQAAAFSDYLDVTGIFLAKLDGTAKGGVVCVIREELGLPVKFVGLGEQPTDIAPFDARRFVDGMLT